MSIFWDSDSIGNPICTNFTPEPIWQALYLGNNVKFSVENPVAMLAMNLILIGCATILGVFVIGRVCWTKKGRQFLVQNRFLVLLLTGLPFLNSVMDVLVIIQLVGESNWVWTGVIGGMYVLCGFIVGTIVVVRVGRGRNCFVVWICNFVGMGSLNSMWALTDTLRHVNHDTENGQSEIKRHRKDLQHVARLNFYYFQTPLAFAWVSYGVAYNAFTPGTTLAPVFISAACIAALNSASMFVGEIGRGNSYTNDENIYWEYQFGTFVYRLSEYCTRIFFVALIACAYKWYAVGILLLEILLWTAIGASSENKSQRQMQTDKKKTIKSLRDAKKSIKRSKRFGKGNNNKDAPTIARCDQQFGSALGWAIAAMGMMPRELRDKLSDRASDGTNPYMGAITPLPYYLVRTLEIFIVGSLWGNGIGFLPNDHLVPSNGTCQDCREHDYAVIIWIISQILMICMVPLILTASPKNSSYPASRCCYNGDSAQRINEVELPTFNNTNATATTTTVNVPVNDEIVSTYATSPNRVLGISPMRSADIGASPNSRMTPSPNRYGLSNERNFRQLSVASLAAQRFRTSASTPRSAAYNIPSPRPRATLPQPMNSAPRMQASNIPSVYTPSLNRSSPTKAVPSPLQRI